MSEEERLEQYERLVAGAVRFLVEGDEHDAASVLLSCEIDGIDYGSASWDGSLSVYPATVRLRGPRAAFEILQDARHPTSELVIKSLNAVLPHDEWLERVEIRVKVGDVDIDWRQELSEIARGRGVFNQASASATKTWRGLRFRSVSEIRIAESLDRAGVLFFPLCLGRLTESGQRKTREPDFLICNDGKWGILDVDGEPFHPPQRTVHDHQRDRLFKSHGVRIVEHYDATECYERSDNVVSGFLGLLRRT